MLGVADYQHIRTNEPLVLELNTNMDPVAEFTKLGWTLCEGVTRKTQFEKHYFVNDERSEFQNFEDAMQPEEFNHQTFKNHIKYCEKGYYETALPWKLNYPPLQTADQGATISHYKKIRKNGEARAIPRSHAGSN